FEGRAAHRKSDLSDLRPNERTQPALPVAVHLRMTDYIEPGRISPTASYTNSPPHPEEAQSAVSKDEATDSVIPGLMVRDARAALLTMRGFDAVGLARNPPPSSDVRWRFQS
ncbi:hypothetical protein CEE75_13610, partial [Lactobacillus crispatus]